jgi:hypothetical protein
MTSPDSDPRRTPGLESGGVVRPGNTPPAEGRLSETGPPEQPIPRRAWGSTSIIITLIVGLLIAAMLLTMAVVLLRGG